MFSENGFLLGFRPVVGGFQQTNYHIAINLNKQMLRKVAGYSGQSTMAACPTCHSVLCANTITLVFVDGKL